MAERLSNSQRRYSDFLGMTQAELAAAAKVPLNAIFLFCSGKLTNKTLNGKIFAAMNVPATQQKHFVRNLMTQVEKDLQKRSENREKRRRTLINYLRTHPKAETKDIKRAGLATELVYYFGGNINEARKEAGVPEKRHLSKQERKIRILSYLRKHPEATITQIKRDGVYQDLTTGYKNLLGRARIDAGLRPDEPKRRRQEQRADPRHKQSLLTWLQKHPFATHRDLIDANLHEPLEFHFAGGLSRAKRAAKIFPDHVLGAEAARKLHVSRERAYQLFRTGILKGFRSGRFIYVTKDSVKAYRTNRHLKNRKPTAAVKNSKSVSK